MTLRAFRATFLVAIDENELDTAPETPITLEQVKEYLTDALILSFNEEDYGNPCGVQSMEVGIDSLTELPADEVAKLYVEVCRYCGGNCPNEPEDSEHLCDGFAGDIENLYGTDPDDNEG